MLSASKIALTPELAVQSEIARLTIKLTPNVVPPSEAVYGNQSRDARKNSEERVERDASGDQEDAVFRNTMIDPQKNVLPSPGRGLRRRLRRPARAGFKRPAIAWRGARTLRPPSGKSECDQQGAAARRTG